VRPTAKSRRWLPRSAAAVILALVAAGFFYNGRASALTEKDFILLTDSPTPPVIRSRWNPEAKPLAVQLEQSPFLNVYPQERVREALKFAGHSPDDRVTVPVAVTYASAKRIKAVLSGSIGSMGSDYVVTLEALNCRTGDTHCPPAVPKPPAKRKFCKLSETAAKTNPRAARETWPQSNVSVRPSTRPPLLLLKLSKRFPWETKSAPAKGDLAALARSTSARWNFDPNFAVAYAAWELCTGMKAIFASLRKIRRRRSICETAPANGEAVLTDHYYNDVTGELPKPLKTSNCGFRPIPATGRPQQPGRRLLADGKTFRKLWCRRLECLRSSPTTFSPIRTRWARTFV